MVTVDISGKLREYLLSNPAISAIVGDRVGTPKVYMENGEPAETPNLSFKQMGGGTGYDRYMFIAEAETPMEARELAILTMNWMCEEAVGFDGVNIEFVYRDGGIIDTINDDSRNPQAMFYLRIELYEY